MIADIEAGRAAIVALHQEAARALNAGDLDALMAVYDPDVISLPPGQAPRVGKAAVRQMWQEALSPFAVDVRITTEEVEIAGPWAFERGRFEMGLEPRAGGATVPESGKFLDILRRQPDGAWRYWRVSWNDNPDA
jgi:uncharacterized protein (TIGR02246 family)